MSPTPAVNMAVESVNDALVPSAPMMEEEPAVPQNLTEKPNKEDLDVDMDQGGQSSSSTASVYDDQLVFPKNRANVFQQQVSYRCTFKFKPEMLTYYYSPGPKGYHDGKPVLLGSPEFDGGWNTKWQICLTINRWIGTQRWMSLYLTRTDDESIETPLTLKLQCEFKIVDEDSKVLYSQRNVAAATYKHETCGFTKFLPFRGVEKLLCHNCLHIEAHLTLLSLSLETKQKPQDFLKESSEKRTSEASTVVEDWEDSSDTLLPIGFEYEEELDEENRVALQYEGKFVIYADREKLKAKSPRYAECLEHHTESRHVVNFPAKYPEGPEKEQKMIREYIKFVHEDHCKALESGSYEDVHMLLHFSNKMGTQELVARCLTALTMKMTVCTAALHAGVVRTFSDRMNVDDVNSYQTFFRELSETNYNKIRQSDHFKQMMDIYSADFAALAFMPSN